VRILVAAIGGAVILLVVGVLIARAIAGSDGGAEATTTAPPTTATTTTPTTTTPTTTTPTTTTPTTTTPTTIPEGVTLRRGDSGEEVRQVQAALVKLGYSTGGVDGKFGPATAEAVLAFQKASGLKEDGIVGPATLSAMSAALSG
jgi:peptidoglycan hydrolase-like protein with peptidoglycan-binding domain